MSRLKETRAADSWWKKADLRLKVAVAFVTIVGTTIAATAAIMEIVRDPPAPVTLTVEQAPVAPPVDLAEVALETSAPALTARQINECMIEHELGAPRAVARVGGDTETLFKRCDWPPLVPSSLDGYSEVRHGVTRIDGMGAADQYSEIDTLHAPCERLVLTFALLHMADRLFQVARLESGRVLGVAVEGRPAGAAIATRLLSDPPTIAVIPPPAIGVFHVMRSGHVSLFDARCARES